MNVSQFFWWRKVVGYRRVVKRSHLQEELHSLADSVGSWDRKFRVDGRSKWASRTWILILLLIGPFFSSVPMKKGTLFFFPKASEPSSVIFTRKIGQAVGPMEDDKYQPCYIPTNTLQVASSLRGCFRFRWFVFLFLFFSGDRCEFHMIFCFFQWKTHKNRSPKSSSIRKQHTKNLHRKTGEKQNPACRRLMPNCRSQWIFTDRAEDFQPC